MASGLQLGSSSRLVQQGDDMQNELERILRTIDEIYETFDNLKLSWTGQKADESKKVLEEVRLPLKRLCESTQAKSTAVNNIGKLLSDYRDK